MTAGGVEDAQAVAITAAVGMAIEGGIATKADLDALQASNKADIAALRAHVDVGFANVDTKFADMDKKIDVGFANVRTEIARSMYWAISAAVVLLGGLITVLSFVTG